MPDDVKELLRRYTQEVSNPSSSFSNDIVSSNNDIETKIYKINETIIQREEAQKLRLRDKLTDTVTKFIWVQLVFFNSIVFIIVVSVTVKLGIFKDVTDNVATLLFDFLKYYISVTIVELLGMLVFILHYVFSKYSGMEIISNIKNKLTKG